MYLSDIVKATGGRLAGSDSPKPVSGVSIDSRTIKRGELFIAIKGRNFNGHDFIKEAMRKGASGIVSRFALPHLFAEAPVIVVGDTIKALGDIAMYHRKRFDIPVIGITGSNGKTTVKEITAHILGARFNVLKNRDTENNFIGLPLTLLRLKPNHQIAVLEMGASCIGEIDRLSRILQPTIGVITNIGPSHLEYFGNLNNVLKAKTEILNHMRGSPLVLNGDDRLLGRLERKPRPVAFGIKDGNDFRATNITEGEEKLEFDLNDSDRFSLNLAGRHNIYNSLAGIAVASMLGMDSRAIQESLAAFKALSMRMQITSINGIRIIDDTYNSNPLSSKCAIQFLSGLKTKGKKILVTGDMLELGRRARYFHKKMGELVATTFIDRLVTVGELSKEVSLAARRAGMKRRSIRECVSRDEAASALEDIVCCGDTVLVKGSRGMGMEKIIEQLRNSKVSQVKIRT